MSKLKIEFNDIGGERFPSNVLVGGFNDEIQTYKGNEASGDVRITDESIKIYGSSSTYQWRYGNGIYKKIDLTNFNSIRFYFLRTSTNGNTFIFLTKTDPMITYASQSNHNVETDELIETIGDHTASYTKNITSYTGEYYVGLLNYQSTNEFIDVLQFFAY